jgi:hypothetical protein
LVTVALPPSTFTPWVPPSISADELPFVPLSMIPPPVPRQTPVPLPKFAAIVPKFSTVRAPEVP